MHIHREFHDPAVVRWLEHEDEKTLAGAMREIAIDREIGKAMDESKALDNQERNLTLCEFIGRECKPSIRHIA